MFFSVLFAVLDPWDSSLAVDLEDVVENGEKIFLESLCCAGNKKIFGAFPELGMECGAEESVHRNIRTESPGEIPDSRGQEGENN